jgi:hypothetical protein
MLATLGGPIIEDDQFGPKVSCPSKNRWFTQDLENK